MKSTFKTACTSILAMPMILAAGVASAGGLAEPVAAPAPAPVIAPAPVPVGTDWTGFYAGGQLGFGQIESDVLTDDEDGAIYGVHAGYLYDLGSFVLGGELDYDASNIEGETADPVDVELDSVARLKFIAGYDAGSFLPYVTAGVARATVSVDGDDADDDGRFAGLGLAYQLSDTLRLGGEVLRHEFEEFDGGEDIDATTATLRVSFQF